MTGNSEFERQSRIVAAAPVDQFGYAMQHGIGIESGEYADGRYALSWDELRDLDREHVVASHARSHEEIAPTSDEDREAEGLESQRTLIREVGHPARTFVSRGGPAHGDHEPTDRLIDAAGYQFVVSGYRIQRLFEASRA